MPHDSSVIATLRAHPRLFALGAFLLAAALAVPIGAYVIVPIFVRSTLVEPPPQPSLGTPAATATSGATALTTPPERTVAQGELVRISAVDFGSGQVRLISIEGTGGVGRYLRFENVEIAAAPDMYVYLSDRTDGKPGTYIDLGKLKATSGSFNYQIEEDDDLAPIRSVVVWCRQFKTTITYALLRP